MDLLLDVKILIARQDEQLWLKMILWDEEFATYAYSLTGINKYKLLFNVPHQREGYIEYLLCQKRHREDQPAIFCANGDQEWWYQGKRHRENHPAVIYVNGTQQWWYQGKCHREDGPVIKNGIIKGNFIEKMDPQSFTLMVLNIGIIKGNVIEKRDP